MEAVIKLARQVGDFQRELSSLMHGCYSISSKLGNLLERISLPASCPSMAIP